MTDGIGSRRQDSLVLHALYVVVLLRDVVQGSVALHAVQEFPEVEQCRLAARCGWLQADEFRVAHDVIQPAEAHLCQILAHLLRQEAEIVDHIFIVPTELLSQFGILRSYAHWASVCVAFAHHHTSQHDEGKRAKGKLVGTQQSHCYHIPAGLQLAVSLQAHLMTQTVEGKCLLCFTQSYLGADACKTHRTGR